MKNEYFIRWNMEDTTANEDSTPSATQKQDFSDLDLLKETTLYSANFITLENDVFLLDGTMDELPDSPTGLPFWSILSDENGEFERNPTLEFVFTKNHSSTGLILFFSKRKIPSTNETIIKCSWYDIGNNLLAEETSSIDLIAIYFEKKVVDFRKIVVEFIKIEPHQFAKVEGIKYGISVVFLEDVIQNGNLSQNLNPISDKIPINELTFSIVDENNEFNLANQNGLHKFVQKEQPIILTRTYNGNEYSEYFYLKSFDAKDSIVTITACNLIGLLDNKDYVNGEVYSNKLAGELLEDIFDTAGLLVWQYSIDDETYNTELRGTIKKTSCRNALREVLFACGSIFEIKKLVPGPFFRIIIKKQSKTVQSNFARSRKFSTVTEKAEYISDVSIAHNSYTLNTNVVQVLSATYPAGDNLIEFTEPVANLSTSVGTITEQSAYYCVLTLASESAIIITGNKYDSKEIVTTYSAPNLPSGETKKIKTFSASLSKLDMGMAKAKEIQEYYSQGLSITTRLPVEDESVGDWCVVENSNSDYADYVAGIESMSTDLRGFISTVNLRGYYQTFTESNYVGEFYAGEWGFL